MSNVISRKTIPPHAIRTIEGLRDTGYEFNTAMADIIDNSIAANASIVEISIKMDYVGELLISIADNGDGMNEDGLLAAMTYGSPQRETLKSLGKFGLGLKTASTAFCRRLSVLTRDSKDSPFYKACWDLDHVATAEDWELLLLNPNDDEINLLDHISQGGSGTVVTWEKVDRLLKDYQDRSGHHARTALNKIVSSLKEHIAMIYHRFLDESYKNASNIIIRVNDQEIEGWDPFCLKEPHTELLASKEQPVEFSNGLQTSFQLKAYTIPRTVEFSSEEAMKRAKISNDMQGFFVYRENRMINYGNWMGMYIKEPHLSLLRVEFSFDYLMDNAFHVDIKKSSITLDGDLFKNIKDEFLSAPRRAANERYRTGQKEKVKAVTQNAHEGSNKGIGYREKDVLSSKVEIKDIDNNEVEITNEKGKVTIKLPISKAAKEGEVFVAPVESIEDGLLWEPTLIDTHHAIRINTNHSYYHKVYVPNLKYGVTIQGIDSLLWALGEAELATISENTRYHLKEIRYTVSRILRRLADDLPDPGIDGNDTD